MISAICCNKDAMQVLIESGADVNENTDPDGNSFSTPLFALTTFGYNSFKKIHSKEKDYSLFYECVDFLLDKGAKIKTQKPYVDSLPCDEKEFPRLDFEAKILTKDMCFFSHYTFDSKKYTGFSPIHFHAGNDTQTLEILLRNKELIEDGLLDSI